MFAPRFDPLDVGDGSSKGAEDSFIAVEPRRSRKRWRRSSTSSGDEVGDEVGDESVEVGETRSGSSSDGSIDGGGDSDRESDENSDVGVGVSDSVADSDDAVADSDDSDDDADEEDTSMEEDSDIEETQARDTQERDVQDRKSDAEYLSKHQSVFSKLNKSIVKTPRQENEQETDSRSIDTHELAPLPQPRLPRDRKLEAKSSYLNNLNWLANPTYTSPEITKPFKSFTNPGLSPKILTNLHHMGFDTAFSVQVSVLETLLQDSQHNKLQPDFRGDLLVNAATGTGKTLAYSTPLVEVLQTRVVPKVRAIILVPTKPLINQVKTTLIQLSRGTNLVVVSLKSDKSIKDEGDKLQCNEPDIIVSTPGRLVEHLNNNSISLKNLRYLVIDEADRLLNQSFQDWCQVVMSKLDEGSDPITNNICSNWRLRVQKLIFSATLTTDAGKLSLLKFHQPRLIIVNDSAELVNEMFSVPAPLQEFKLQIGSAKSSLKPLILAQFLISQNKLSNVLIFTKSNEASLRLAKLLGILLSKLHPSHPTPFNVAFLNSTNNKTTTRQNILKEFASSKINILVVTDLISRGIDILSITDVINYDLPNSSREYVHRVGRTARANNSGYAYTFCFGKGEGKWFSKLVSNVGRGTKTVENIDLDPKYLGEKQDELVYKEALTSLHQQVRSNAKSAPLWVSSGAGRATSL